MKKGFTLIELLIVIAIIGILAGIVVGVTSSARTKAATTATKASLSGLRSAIALCCDNPNGSLQNMKGADICNPPIGTLLPTEQQLNATSVAYTVLPGGCATSSPGYTITLSGHPNSNCNGSWKVTVTEFQPPSGCQ